MGKEHDKAFVSEHLRDDLSRLVLKIHGDNELNVPWIIQQIAGYQSIEKKLPTWYKSPDIVFPISLSLEQCSSEVTALYKQSIVDKIARHESGTDLTGGFGVDAWALSSLFDSYHYVERQTELCKIADNNFRVLDRQHIEVHNTDARSYLEDMPPVDFIFMDPARRGHKGGKMVQLSDCEPDVTQLIDKLKAKTRFLLLKLSPMLDISLALKALPNVHEIHVVAVDNDCKELLILLDFHQCNDMDIPIVTVNLSSQQMPKESFTFTKAQESAAGCVLADDICHYLYEPNVAVLKGGAFKQTGSVFHLSKLHTNTHLYTSDNLEKAFPGKIFEVLQVLKPSAKETKNILLQTAQANVCVRNYPESTDTLRRRFHIKDGGNNYIYGLTLHPNEHLLILCRRINKT